MLGLIPEAIRLIEIISVIIVLIWLSVLVGALLARQVFRFGFDRSWGPDGKDINIDGF